jgi:hypothetical protein
MSVTFEAASTADMTDERVFRLTCSGDEQPIGEFVGYGNAYLEAQAHGLICADTLCAGYGADLEEIHADGAPVPVNVNNRNAMDLLAVLGYPVALDPEERDLAGVDDAAAFLARVEVALALAPADPGLPTIAYRDGATVTDCGRRPGYLQERLAGLRDLALACQAAGARVAWH